MRELPTPRLADGQVLVRVRAAGVNPFDAYVAGGYVKDVMEHRFPLVPGHDAAGVAALPLAGATALTLLDAVALGAGERLLVLGSSGGVGSYLVQLAARRGAQVLGVCSGPNLAYARGLGAET